MDRILRSLARNCYDYHVNEIFFAIDTEYSDYQVFSHTEYSDYQVFPHPEYSDYQIVHNTKSTATIRSFLKWRTATIRSFLTRSTATIKSSTEYKDYQVLKKSTSTMRSS
jgi:hypothetical protein